MTPNNDYFIVRIDKAAQTIKRNKVSMPVRASFGVWSNEPKGDESEQPLRHYYGVRVDRIAEDSPAQHAGFQMGDVITHFDGVQLESFTHLAQLLMQCKPAQVVEVKYQSGFALAAGLEVINAKQVALGSFQLVLEQKTTEMDNNLQWGTIVAIGRNAAEIMPQARIGDWLLLHHSVEYKPRETGESALLYNDKNLLGILPSEDGTEGDELRLCNARWQTFGVVSAEDKVIYPHPDYIFCHKVFQPASFQVVDGIWMPEGWKMKMQDYVDKLAELELQFKALSDATVMKQRTSEANYRKKEEIMALIRDINNERAKLSVEMNKPKLADVTVMYVSEDTNDYLGSELKMGDKLLVNYTTLYPLSFEVYSYVLARKDYVLAKLNEKNLSE